ncbi:MAG: DUF5808 domain-containing protein [Chloroflexi bacterium]|nr:DUF5808 domain-containing protein [Chloroflexota bacterium]
MRRLGKFLRFLAIVAFVIIAIRNFGKEGKFLGVPYSFKMPTPDLVRERFWNPADSRIFTPHIFGWGYSINLYALGKMLGLV